MCHSEISYDNTAARHLDQQILRFKVAVNNVLKMCCFNPAQDVVEQREDSLGDTPESMSLRNEESCSGIT